MYFYMVLQYDDLIIISISISDQMLIERSLFIFATWATIQANPLQAGNRYRYSDKVIFLSKLT